MTTASLSPQPNFVALQSRTGAAPLLRESRNLNAKIYEKPSSAQEQKQYLFLKVVRDGIPDKGMQAWDKLLDTKQINQIHLYVLARTDKVLPPGRVDEVGPNGGPWVPPSGWPQRK